MARTLRRAADRLSANGISCRAVGKRCLSDLGGSPAMIPQDIVNIGV
jgi:hypothetical protein